MGAPIGLLASPRRRRRLAWAGGVLAFLGGLVAFAVLYPDVEREPEVMSNEPAVIVTTPPNVALTKEAKAATIATANAFLRFAVARRNPERSWEYVHPSLREGYTKASWSTGDIPVVPYPVDSAVYRLDYSHPNLVGWRVSVYPKPGAQARPMTFFMDVTLSGAGDDRRWRVSNWSPASVADAGPAPGAGAEGGNAFAIGAVGGEESRVSPLWLVIPLGLVGVPILVVAATFVRDRRRTAAAERAYSSTTSPS